MSASPSEAGTRWLNEEETYLENLSGLCQELSGRYKDSFEAYKIIQARFRIPSIVVSSITGLTSFGSSNFPPEYREWVSISVGIASLSIAILSSIESYWKIGEHLAGASQASVELHKLKEYIDMELALPKDKRLTQGALFLRDCYTRYERILEIAPDLLRILRFIRPSYDEHATVDVERRSNKPSTIQARLQNAHMLPSTVAANAPAAATVAVVGMDAVEEEPSSGGCTQSIISRWYAATPFCTSPGARRT